jgi:bacteriocin-like protein
MATIKIDNLTPAEIDNLKPAGVELFFDSESFMNELSNDELEHVQGGRALASDQPVIITNSCPIYTSRP